ncbi:hypothetical protein D0502_06040 [Leuconostoc falkenbergense]|uniref:Permease of the major facilitator superfamily n=1 Tax=Leuconostoc falkenbergense TaxID=2766470 RepID=A0A9X3EHB7_9LACO|nr:hypothetical protein [Leuconostoc falkenbergense]MCX7578940.1 hypothetical protein [Leuconostoc falkenbergense]
MFNYRRVYINSAKFSKIGKGMRLPIMVDTRFLYLFSITIIITAFISYVLGWFHMQYLSLGFGLMIVSEVAVYYLDRQLKRDNLPFETTIRYLVTYVWQFWFRKNQLYQGKRVNSNSKQYMIL